MWIDYIRETMEKIEDAVYEISAFGLALSWFFVKAITGVCLLLTVPLWIVPYRIYKSREKKRL